MNRICFFSGVPIDDSATFFRTGVLAKELIKKGYKIDFLSVSMNFNKKENKNVNGLNVIFIGQSHYKAQKKFSTRKRLNIVQSSMENLKTCFRLAKFLLGNKPNRVLIVTTMPVSLLAGFTSKILGFKTLLDMEDYSLGQMKASGYSNFLINFYTFLEKIFIRFFNKIIVPSSFLQKKYSGSVLIPNMIDLKFWKSKKIKIKQKKAVFLGQMGNYHGQKEVLEAFLPILRRNGDFKLVFIGAGEERSKINPSTSVRLRSLQALRARNQIEITGYLSQNMVRKILLESEVGILPLWDTPVHRARHPLKLLEYLACGLIVLTNKVGEAEKIIKDGINGVLCPKGDIDCLAKETEKILKKPVLFDKMRQNALNSAENFSYDKILPLWIKALDL